LRPQDDDEWRQWKRVGDPVMHIELRRWADVMVIAPLSANTLAKAAGGMCDNLLTCVLRAWDWGRPLLVSGLALRVWRCAFAQNPIVSWIGLSTPNPPQTRTPRPKPTPKPNPHPTTPIRLPQP